MSRSKIYTFTFSMPHHAREGDWWAEMLDNFEVVEVLSETAFLAVRIGRVRLLWFRLKAWVRRAAAAIGNKLEKSEG